jgi:hypothetical protein
MRYASLLLHFAPGQAQIVVCCYCLRQVLVVIWALQNAYFFLLLLLTICGVYGAHRYNKWCVVGVSHRRLQPQLQPLVLGDSVPVLFRVLACVQYLVYLCANIVLRIWWMAAKPNVLLIVLLIIGLVFEVRQVHLGVFVLLWPISHFFPSF